MRSIDWRWNFSKIPSGIQIQVFVSIHRPFHVSAMCSIDSPHRKTRGGVIFITIQLNLQYTKEPESELPESRGLGGSVSKEKMTGKNSMAQNCVGSA